MNRIVRFRMRFIAARAVLTIRLLELAWRARRVPAAGAVLLAAAVAAAVLLPQPTVAYGGPASMMVTPYVTTARAKPHEYRVRPGDSLDRIATHLHLEGGWKRLWRLNQDTITDPNRIVPRQVLRLR